MAPAGEYTAIPQHGYVAEQWIRLEQAQAQRVPAEETDVPVAFVWTASFVIQATPCRTNRTLPKRLTDPVARSL
uniref:Uncharacterized protein n=1 Tax=Peronospora matthiolae TaxID=2874970 RepID=A0AAV1VHX4_9STRA